MRDTKFNNTIYFFSFVNGGPIDRIVDTLNTNVSCKLIKLFNHGSWRFWMNKGRIGRIAARLAAFAIFPAKALYIASKHNEGILVPTTNPFFLPHLLVATSAWHGHRVVPLLYDMYPDAWEATGMTSKRSPLARIAARFNQWLFANADAIVFIGDKMAQYAISRYGEPRLWRVIETGADTSEFANAESLLRESSWEMEEWCGGRLLMTYTGNLGHVHDWTTLADGLERLLDSPLQQKLACLIVASGPGVDYLKRRLKNISADALRFEGAMDDGRWAKTLVRSAISLVTLNETAAHTSVPSKTFSAMGAGNAIVAIGPGNSDLFDVVSGHACGAMVNPGDVDGFVQAITRLVADDQWRAVCTGNAKKAVDQQYHMAHLAKKWEELFGLVRRKKAVLPGYERMKRALDVFISLLALVGLSPVLAISSLMVRISLGSPVFFRQERPGKGGKPFQAMKLRTMRHPKPGEENAVFDVVRLTRLGRLLRATSIDELPTLVNVIKGDMSLVGPRPLLLRYLERYSPEQRRRHEVLPGITGWAQANGRNALSWEEKFAHDVWYVDNRSLLLDLKILLKTAMKVIQRDGISHKGDATMPEFLGESTVKVPKDEQHRG